MVVELCPAPKQSYSLSDRLVNPASPEVCLNVCILPRRPVKILCGYVCIANTIVTQSFNQYKIYPFARSECKGRFISGCEVVCMSVLAVETSVGESS
jgi:hypothetical protein